MRTPQRLARFRNAAHLLGSGMMSSRIAAISGVGELNIGHSIVSRAVTVGLGQAVREILELMDDYPQAE